MTQKELSQRRAVERKILSILAGREMAASQIAGHFSGNLRVRVVGTILPFMEREGFLVGNYNGGPEKVFRSVAR